MEKICPTCSDNFVVNNKYLTCGYCEEQYHNVCIKIKDTFAKSINDSTNVVWYCNYCLKSVHQSLANLTKIQENTDTILKQTLQCVKMLEDTKHQKEPEVMIKHDGTLEEKSYAAAVKESVVLIKPRKVCDSKETTTKIKENIIPEELGIGIKEVRENRNGSVVIKCRDDCDAKVLKNSLEEKMGNSFSAIIPGGKCPRLKVVGIEKEYTHEKLLQVLISQNKEIFCSESSIKVIIIKKMLKSYLAIIECDQKSFQNLNKKSENSVFIGHRSCRYYEYVNIIKCYNCCKFGHFAKECKLNKICGKCMSEGHDTRACTSEVARCTNCVSANIKHGLKLNVEHTSFDMNCPCYLRQVKVEQAKIQYAVQNK